MNILVTNVTSNSIATYYEMTCDNAEMFVAYYHSGAFEGQVNCLVQNASHRAFRRMGRTFDSWDAALAAYKSSAAKAMIEHARDCENAARTKSTAETVAA